MSICSHFSSVNGNTPCRTAYSPGATGSGMDWALGLAGGSSNPVPAFGYPDNGLTTWMSKALACRPPEGKPQEVARQFDVGLLVAHRKDGLRMWPASDFPGHVYLQGDTEALHIEWANSRPFANQSPH